MYRTSKKKCDIVIQGNTDFYFSRKHEHIEELPQQEQNRIKWNQSLIDRTDRNYLLNLQFSDEFYMSGSLVRLFHATNKANDKVVLNISDLKTKYDMFLPSENTISDKIADVVVYGHIHHQYMDKIYNKTLINVGSVGNSFDTIRNDVKDSDALETTKACYVIIEGDYGNTEYNSEISFQFIKVPYNIEKELEDEDKNIEKENYRCELIQGKYRDMAKINNRYKKLGIDVDEI